jgi:hypothetical protein
VVQGSILGHQQVHRLHAHHSVRPLSRCNTQHSTLMFDLDILVVW